MLLYNEDILDCLDQATAIKLNLDWFHNCNEADLFIERSGEAIHWMNNALKRYDNERQKTIETKIAIKTKRCCGRCKNAEVSHACVR